MGGASGHEKVSKCPQVVKGQVWEIGKHHWQHLMAAATHPQ